MMIRPGLVYPSLFYGGPQKQITTVSGKLIIKREQGTAEE